MTPPWGVPVTVSDTTPSLKHPCTQPLPQQLEHPPVRHALCRPDRATARGRSGRRSSVMSASKTNCLPLGKRNPDRFHGVGGRPLGPEPERAGQEVGLEDRFEDDLRRLLGHPVSHSGDTQRPHSTVGLWDLHPAHWRRAVDACTEVTLGAHRACARPRSPPPPPGSLDRPRRRHDWLGPAPRLPQDVTPVDAVIQGVETPTLRLLGRSP